MKQILQIFKRQLLRRKKLILALVYVYAFGFFIFLCHEKILNTVDLFTMPRKEEMCKHIPFNLSEFYEKVDV